MTIEYLACDKLMVYISRWLRSFKSCVRSTAASIRVCESTVYRDLLGVQIESFSLDHPRPSEYGPTSLLIGRS